MLWLGIPILCCIKMVAVDFLVFFLILKSFCFSLSHTMLAADLSYLIFIMLRYIPSIASLLRVAIINGFWIFSNPFFASIEKFPWFGGSVSLMWFPGIIPLDHVLWSFKCIVEFGLLIFCWEMLHLLSSEMYVYVLVVQWYFTLCNSIDCSAPSSPVHAILQAKILEWVAVSYSRASSQPRDWTWVYCIVGRFFTIWATKEGDMACNFLFRNVLGFGIRVMVTL